MRGEQAVLAGIKTWHLELGERSDGWTSGAFVSSMRSKQHQVAGSVTNHPPAYPHDNTQPLVCSIFRQTVNRGAGLYTRGFGLPGRIHSLTSLQGENSVRGGRVPHVHDIACWIAAEFSSRVSAQDRDSKYSRSWTKQDPLGGLDRRRMRLCLRPDSRGNDEGRVQKDSAALGRSRSHNRHQRIAVSGPDGTLSFHLYASKSFSCQAARSSPRDRDSISSLLGSTAGVMSVQLRYSFPETMPSHGLPNAS
jgi:hypothetical protein